MNRNDIFEKVCECLREAGDIRDLEIKPEMSLIDDLEMDSIDLVDFTFRLEQAFGVKFPAGELEERTRKEMGDVEFEINTVVTPEGLEHLKTALPEVPPRKFLAGMTIYDLPSLISELAIMRVVGVGRIASRIPDF